MMDNDYTILVVPIGVIKPKLRTKLNADASEIILIECDDLDKIKIMKPMLEITGSDLFIEALEVIIHHGTPSTKDAFIKRFAELIKKGIIK